MILLELNVCKQTIIPNIHREVISDSVGFLYAKINLDKEWENLKTKIVIYSKDISADILIPENMLVEIPSNFLKSGTKLKFTISGYAENGNKILHTKEMLSSVDVLSAGKFVGDVPEQYQPSLWQQVIAEIDNISSIAIEVERRANNGEFNGKDGAPGANGKDGDQGDKGDKGDDYVLTDADKAEIAEKITGTIAYYSTLSGAIADVNADTIGTNTDATKDTAIASVSIVDGEKVVTLLKDTTETTEMRINTNMTLDLNGKCLSFGTGAWFRVNDSGATLTINGETTGSKIYKNLETSTNSQGELLVLAAKGTVKVIGGELELIVGECTGTWAVVFYGNKSGNFDLKKCKINANLTAGTAQTVGIYNMGSSVVDECTINTNSTSKTSYALNNASTGVVTAKNSKFFADGLSGNDADYSQISLGIKNAGTLELVDCEAYGTHSGLQHNGVYCHINGGLYEGVQHGGIYLAGGDADSPKTIYIENATISSAPYKGKNKTLYKHEPSSTAMYVSSGSYMSAYLDNCIIRGGHRWIMAISYSNNNVYISNCTIDMNFKGFASSTEINGGTDTEGNEIKKSVIGLTEDELAVMNAEEGDSKTLPRPAIRVDSIHDKVYLGKGNKFKINHLLAFFPPTVTGYDDIHDVMEDTSQAYYIREFVEQTAE